VVGANELVTSESRGGDPAEEVDNPNGSYLVTV
jgi:hypothetical protein